MNDERAINQFIIKSLKNKLNLLDTGKALRTYCYITDISKNFIIYSKFWKTNCI